VSDRCVMKGEGRTSRWFRPWARLQSGQVICAGAEPRAPKKRKHARDFDRLAAMPEDELRAVISRGMSASACCAALGVGGRGFDEFFMSRPDLRAVWSQARIKAMWGE